MGEYGLCKPNIYDYFTTFPVADVLNDCMATIEKAKTLHQVAVEINSFIESYLELPIDQEPSYLNSIELQMNAARQGFNIVDFAYWWSVWNITKVMGSLDNSYWENRPRLTDRALLDTLNDFLNIQMPQTFN